MRILYTFAGGSGHLDPLVPFARSAATAGHVVAFAGRPWMTPVVEALGFEAYGSGSDAGLTPVRRPLFPIDMEREACDLRDGFARRIARERAADVLRLCLTWRPDVLVCEETDFGPMVVAEHLGIPHATVVVLAAGGLVRPEVLAEPLDALRAAHGLRPDPDLEMLERHLVLSPFPPSLRDPAFPLPSTAHAIRPAVLDEPTDAWQPSWLDPAADRPLVFTKCALVWDPQNPRTPAKRSAAPASLRQFHRVWNGLILSPLPALDLESWGESALAARARLLQQADLTRQLMRFVEKTAKI